jgi:outer membrane protein insertion porin family
MISRLDSGPLKAYVALTLGAVSTIGFAPGSWAAPTAAIANPGGNTDAIALKQQFSQNPQFQLAQTPQTGAEAASEAAIVDPSLRQLQRQSYGIGELQLNAAPSLEANPAARPEWVGQRPGQRPEDELELTGFYEFRNYRGPFRIDRLPVFTPEQLEELDPGFYFDMTGDAARDKGFYLRPTLGWRADSGDMVELMLEGGERTASADLSYTKPAITGDERQTGFQIGVFSLRSPDNIFVVDEDDELEEIFLPTGDDDFPWIHRLGGRLRLYVPASETTVVIPGITYQRVSIRDEAFTDEVFPEDEDGNKLTASDDGLDDLLTISLLLQHSAVYRDEDEIAVKGTRAQIGTEQAIPIGDADLSFNRLTGGVVQYVQTDFFGFAEGPRTLVLSALGGATIGDLPPYEGFSLGGYSSVRGFGRGDVGTGSRFVQLGAEYRFPIANFDSNLFQHLRGVLFVDFASDLGSGDDVIGEPGEVRNKPGDGFGFGAGLRFHGVPLVDVFRLDFAVGDGGSLYFGIGEKF